MSNGPADDRQARRRQSIPLRDLLSSASSHGVAEQYQAQQHLEPFRDATSTTSQNAANQAGTYWYHSYSGASSDDGASPESPIDSVALQMALPLDIRQPEPDAALLSSRHTSLFPNSTPYLEESPNTDYFESDRAPLTSGAQPISGSLLAEEHGSPRRDSFQTVSDVDNNSSRTHETRNTTHGMSLGSSGPRNYGNSLNPNQLGVSRSPSTSGALHRAGSIVRAMSQRVVNISGESEIVDKRNSRHRSRSPHGSVHGQPENNTTSSMFVDTSYHSPNDLPSAEKQRGHRYFSTEDLPSKIPRQPAPNPLKGHSLGVFSPESHIRLWLCGLLVNPYTESVILLLIVLQTVLLAVEASPNVFSDGNARPQRWGGRPIDWALLGLFVVFSLELVARTIVSGFVLNAAEYSTIDRKKGVRAAVRDQYRAVFQPQRQKSVRENRHDQLQTSAISRSFTTLMQGQQALPETLEEQQRFQLARRAFLRHSFNRLDFVAVVSYWIAFALGFSGMESRYHLYVFKMLSCLRILRLLALTHGTAVSVPEVLMSFHRKK